MIQLPENIRPAVALLAKHHFWLLSILVPLLLLPLLFAARGGLQAQIVSSQGQIRSKLEAVQSVRRVEPHPNAGWSTEIDADAVRIRRDTLAEWQKFWEGQGFLRVWPKELGDDFLTAVTTLKPNGRLDRNLLRRYQSTIPEIVRQLPARMGADEAMGGDRQATPAGTGRPPAAGDGDRERRSQALLTWNAEDQRRLLNSFDWATLPTNPQAATTQVVLAQEELWVYGLFCDVIARANKDAGGVYNAAIVNVAELAVGYPAAQEKPGGVGGSRIAMPKNAPAATADQPPDMAPMGGPQGGTLSKPSHPRFGGAAAGAGSPPGVEGTPAEAPDASLREWIYVDFSGTPLSAADVATSPAARMVHLMPFVLRLTIDQRRLDALLADLAKGPIPIDVREVRINAGGAKSRTGGIGDAAKTDQRADRTNDVQVELRGTVGLATVPSAAAVGLEPPAPATPDAAATPPRRPARPRLGRRVTA
jgi:hypothetical protein